MIFHLESEYLVKVNSEEKINWNHVNSYYNDHNFNNISKSDNEINFFNLLTEVKKSYYEFLTTHLKFKKITMKKIVESYGFNKFFNRKNILLYLDIYFGNQTLNGIDHKIHEIFIKNEHTYNEMKFVDDIHKIKAIFNFYLKQSKKLSSMKKKFTSFNDIIIDKNFGKLLDIKRVEYFARNLLNIGEHSKFSWGDLDQKVIEFKQNIVKFNKIDLPHDKYKILSHLSEINDQFYEYKNNKKVVLQKKQISNFCSDECVKTCKSNFKTVSEFLSCTHIACLCQDNDLIDKQLVKKDETTNLFIFIVISLISFLLLIIAIVYIRSRKPLVQKNYEAINQNQEYELMKVTEEMEETFLNKID